MPYIHDEWCDYSGIYSAVCGCVDNRHNHKSEVFKMNTDRLRFRFYSIELKRYLSSFEIHAILFSTPASAEYVDDGEDYWQLTCSPDDGFIEQCTGLKDQSGKLIYEGDEVEVFIDYLLTNFDHNNSYIKIQLY